MFQGKLIKDLLKKQGISITNFSEEIGENRSLVTSYLNCRIQPSIKFLYKVINYFPNLDLNQLFKVPTKSINEETTTYAKSTNTLIDEIEIRLKEIKKQANSKK